MASWIESANKMYDESSIRDVHTAVQLPVHGSLPLGETDSIHTAGGGGGEVNNAMIDAAQQPRCSFTWKNSGDWWSIWGQWRKVQGLRNKARKDRAVKVAASGKIEILSLAKAAPPHATQAEPDLQH